jgi:hypothetical protein
MTRPRGEHSLTLGRAIHLCKGGHVARLETGRIGMGHVARNFGLPRTGMPRKSLRHLGYFEFFKHRGFSLDQLHQGLRVIPLETVIRNK